MLTYEQNVKAVLECIFAGYKDALIEDACRQICALSSSENPNTCGDAISRKAVLDLLENTNNGWIINEVLQLPSVTPQQRTGRWIPVSERLPEKATRVLTTWVYVPTGAKYIEVAERWGDDDDYTFYGDTDEYKMNRKDHKVIAWMPLVEPYNAESEEV